MSQEHYSHQRPDQPPAPPRTYIQQAKSGEVFLLHEPDGRRFRATVIAVEVFAVVVSARIGPNPPIQRGFAVNGFELGNYPPAELTPMPESEKDHFRRQELWFEFVEIAQGEGVNTMTAADMEYAIHAARRYKRQRAERRARNLERLEKARNINAPAPVSNLFTVRDYRRFHIGTGTNYEPETT